MKYRIRIKSKNRKTALSEGALKLGINPSEVYVSEEDGSSFIVSRINAPGEFELEASDDKMAAVLRVITPSAGSGTPVKDADIEKALSDMGVVYGIDRNAITSAVKEVNETGKIRRNVIIAKGTPPVKGLKAKIELKTGRDAENKDPAASNAVKPGQVTAVKIPAGPGNPGKNIFGKEIPAVPGEDADFIAGPNISLKENQYISEVYGAARTNWQGISVTDYLKISGDGMYAEMHLFPVLADDSRLSFEDISDILKNRGVKYGIKEEAIKAALNEGTAVENFRVAEAILPKDGIDAKLEFEFKINGLDPEEAANNPAQDFQTVCRDIVLGGEILAKKIPAVKPEDGRSVTGDLLKGQKPLDRKIRAGSNAESRDNGFLFTASEDITAGYACYAKDTISVEIPIEISEDKLTASFNLYPPCSKKRIITLDLVKKLITGAGIKFGIRLDELESKLSSVDKKTAVTVAKGIAPVEGKDAVIDFKFDRNKHAGTFISGTDRMDFKEQSLIINVKKGDVLAEKFPFTAGTDGKNIFGEILQASPGKDSKIIPGANVLLSDDGLTADIDGMVIFSDGGKISVLQSHEISGDIDMHTGNLTMEGSLVIRGWVCSGFTARASGEIHIGKGIEQANIDAGAGLFIHGGILGADKANITTGGNITVFFIENARVHARGDIIIRDDIRNSIVSSSSSIDATGGKGRIIGGTVTAFRSITANEIGSAAGVKTIIKIGVDPEAARRMEKISRRLEEFRRQRAKIDMYLVRFSNKNKSSEIPKNMRFRLDKLIKQRREIASLEIKLNRYKEKLLKKEKELDIKRPSLTVNRIVYAGSEIIIGKSVFSAEEDIKGKVKFYLNKENRIVCLRK